MLLDLVISRMVKGTCKEIDIAATLEHLRDQRAGKLVATKVTSVLVAFCSSISAVLKIEKMLSDITLRSFPQKTHLLISCKRFRPSLLKNFNLAASTNQFVALVGFGSFFLSFCWVWCGDSAYVYHSTLAFEREVLRAMQHLHFKYLPIRPAGYFYVYNWYREERQHGKVKVLENRCGIVLGLHLLNFLPNSTCF